MYETRTGATEQQPDAVVWIGDRRALVARLEPEGCISSVEIRRLQRPEHRYLGDVVHEIGNRQHVLVIGPQPIRLALERRYVGISHRPDRLMSVPPTAGVTGSEILEGLGRLVA